MSEKLSFEQELARHGSFLYTGSGKSMLPLIRPARDLVEIGRRPEGRCGKYDVVLYRSGSRCVLHRILRVGAEDYTLAGDYNHYTERVTDAQIIGVMRAVMRDGKRITPDQFGYRCYVRLWCGCFPARALVLRALRRLRAASRGRDHN